MRVRGIMVAGADGERCDKVRPGVGSFRVEPSLMHKSPCTVRLCVHRRRFPSLGNPYTQGPHNEWPGSCNRGWTRSKARASSAALLIQTYEKNPRSICPRDCAFV